MDIGIDETSPALWSAVWQLADAWSKTPVVQRVADPLPRNRPLSDIREGGTGLTSFLHQLHVRVGFLMNPLMYGSRIPVLMQSPLLADTMKQLADEDEFVSWLENAAKLELAHRRTLAWLRSSLAGYPILRAPQLASGSPLTTDEVTVDFVWSKDELRAGLNRLAQPPGLPELLGVSAAVSAINEATRELATQLGKSGAWDNFRVAWAALDDRAKVQLRTARQELTERLSRDRVDEHEPTLAVVRSEYRRRMTADVLDALAGKARQYADAFGRVHAILTLTACDVFGEVALYGAPQSVEALRVEAPQPGRPIIEFDLSESGASLLNPGQLLWLQGCIVRDAVRLDRITLKADLAHGSREQLLARVLQGTAEGWPREHD